MSAKVSLSKSLAKVVAKRPASVALGLSKPFLLKPYAQHGSILSMSTKVLEQSVTDLQRRVVEIENKLSAQPREGWQKVVGAAKNDTHFAEAMRLGAEWRKQANKEDW